MCRRELDNIDMEKGQEARRHAGTQIGQERGGLIYIGPTHCIFVVIMDRGGGEREERRVDSLFACTLASRPQFAHAAHEIRALGGSPRAHDSTPGSILAWPALAPGRCLFLRLAGWEVMSLPPLDDHDHLRLCAASITICYPCTACTRRLLLLGVALRPDPMDPFPGSISDAI